jgi:hypothetical protein
VRQKRCCRGHIAVGANQKEERNYATASTRVLFTFVIAAGTKCSLAQLAKLLVRFAQTATAASTEMGGDVAASDCAEAGDRPAYCLLAPAFGINQKSHLNPPSDSAWLGFGASM